MENNNFRFFGYGIFALLVVIFGIWFVLANASLAPSTAEAGATISMLWFNVSNTSGGTSTNNLTSITINNTGSATGFNITNVTVSNGTDYYNDSFGSFPATGTIVYIGRIDNSTDQNNFTVKFTLNSSATWNKTVQANITAISKEANVTFFNTSQINSTTTTIDESTAPAATAACSPTAVYIAGDFPCTCTGTDSGATASGVSTSVGSSTAPEGISTPLTVGVFTYTCTVTDVAGNSASGTTTYTVLSVGGKAKTTPSLPKRIHLFTKITPGVVAIMKDFDSEIGIKQIQIEVNNEAQSVKITVTKYDDKPAEVTRLKTRKVNRYLQIETENLADKLGKAMVTLQVEKSWLSSNGLAAGDIALFRFDESARQWNELATSYVGSEGDNELYEIELTSFSYFAISEKAVVEEDERGIDIFTREEGANLVWLWVVIAILILILIGWGMKRKAR